MSNREFGEKVDRYCPSDETTLRKHLGEVGGNICPVCWKVYDILSEPSSTTQPREIEMIEKLKKAIDEGCRTICFDIDACRDILQRLEQAEVMREALLQCHEVMHKTTAVLTFTDCEEVADTMAFARNALNQTKLP